MPGLGKITQFHHQKGFVEATNSSEIGDKTRFPVAFPYDYEQSPPMTVFTALYRVKEFRVQIAAAAKITLPLGQETEFDFTYDQTFHHGTVIGAFPQRPDGFADERDLVGYAGPAMIYSALLAPPIPSFPSGMDFQFYRLLAPNAGKNMGRSLLPGSHCAFRVRRPASNGRSNYCQRRGQHREFRWLVLGKGLPLLSGIKPWELHRLPLIELQCERG